jgi:transcriptional regulator with XRE-family HTH domain
VRATEGGLSKNTVSIAANGLDVNTETLRIIAAALGVSLEEILVSPARQSASEARKQMALEIAERVLRQLDHAPATSPAETAALRDSFNAAEAAARQIEQRQEQTKTHPKRRKRKLGR